MGALRDCSRRRSYCRRFGRRFIFNVRPPSWCVCARHPDTQGKLQREAPQLPQKAVSWRAYPFGAFPLSRLRSRRISAPIVLACLYPVGLCPVPFGNGLPCHKERVGKLFLRHSAFYAKLFQFFTVFHLSSLQDNVLLALRSYKVAILLASTEPWQIVAFLYHFTLK